MVVGHFAVVHTAACRLRFRLHLAFPFGHRTDEGKQFGYFGEHIFGNVPASRSRIGDEFLLVELLCDSKRLLRREAMLGVGLFLECGQVEQEWSFFRLSLRSTFVTVAVPSSLTLLYSAVAGSFSFHFSDEENFTVRHYCRPRQNGAARRLRA